VDPDDDEPGPELDLGPTDTRALLAATFVIIVLAMLGLAFLIGALTRAL